MSSSMKIYNLYPKLVGKMEDWISHFDRIKDMEFDWIYLNPINVPGFSGSDYAIKDYYLYHPLFIKGWPVHGDDYTNEALEKGRVTGNALLKKVTSEAEKRGMKVMLDLVINHTAIDSPLTTAKPEWYKRDNTGKIKNPGAKDGTNWVTWGDLADIDNLNSSDRANLWEYWLDMIVHYCDLGIRGFRCDAAYHVPNELWEYLISKVRKKYPDVVFVAETLGCTPKELISVAGTGFNQVMNSFKWWDYKENWFLKDYKKWAGKYPSITFPENHDTPRYFVEVNGNKDLAIAKYAIEAYFCSSIAITIGFEYGFKRQIDVVKTTPEWQENPNYDISKEIKTINKIKSEYTILQEDNMIHMYNFYNDELFGFTKESKDGKEKIFTIFNVSSGNWHTAHVANMYEVMGGNNIVDISHGYRMAEIPLNFEYSLKPGEVKLFYIKK